MEISPIAQVALLHTDINSGFKLLPSIGKKSPGNNNTIVKTSLYNNNIVIKLLCTESTQKVTYTNLYQFSILFAQSEIFKNCSPTETVNDIETFKSAYSSVNA